METIYAPRPSGTVVEPQMIAEIEAVYTEVFNAPTTCPEPTATGCTAADCATIGKCCYGGDHCEPCL